MKKNIKILLLAVIILLVNCSDENINEPTIVLDDLLVIDSLAVKITYEDTPGFKYPVMSHYYSVVTHLKEKGAVSYYSYNCEIGDISTDYNIDYFKSLDIGYKFRQNEKSWSKKLIDVGSKVPYYINFTADLERENNIQFTYNSTTEVTHSSSEVRPESNSRQLTGPENQYSSPQYSNDGTWIYYRSYKDNNIISRTNSDGEGYQEIESFDNLSWDVSVSLFELLDSNKLAYVLWKPNEYSRIIIKDLQNMTNTEHETKAYLWDSNPIRIPKTNKFLTYQDPNSGSYNGSDRLLIVDLETQEIDTLFNNRDISISSYSINPVDEMIYISIRYENKIIKYNYLTKESEIFLADVKYVFFKFFPNGVDYGFTKKDENGHYNIFANMNGIEKQITTYPSDIQKFNISPDGTKIIFSTKRRNETQSWVVNI